MHAREEISRLDNPRTHYANGTHASRRHRASFETCRLSSSGRQASDNTSANRSLGSGDDNGPFSPPSQARAGLHDERGGKETKPKQNNKTITKARACISERALRFSMSLIEWGSVPANTIRCTHCHARSACMYGSASSGGSSKERTRSDLFFFFSGSETRALLRITTWRYFLASIIRQ